MLGEGIKRDGTQVGVTLEFAVGSSDGKAIAVHVIFGFVAELPKGMALGECDGMVVGAVLGSNVFITNATLIYAYKHSNGKLS